MRKIVGVRGLPTPRRPFLITATDQVPASNDTIYLLPHRNTARLPALLNMSRLPLAHTTADSFSLWGTLSARLAIGGQAAHTRQARRIAANIAKLSKLIMRK